MKIKDWIFPEASEIDTLRDLKIIKEYLPKTGTILDAGGGIGRISIELAKLNYKIVLLDISKKALEIAKAESKKAKVYKKIEFVEGDVCDLSFKDNSFDMVLALRDVINYSVDAEKAVKELIRVLKNDCYLIASVANKTFWLTKEVESEKIKNIISTKKMLKESELKNLFKSLKIEKVVGSGFCSGNIQKENYLKNKENFIEIENIIGDDDEFKFACEYLVIIGKKV
ncbi:MAG: class I SAM-dependent methyltransferase [Candidatus Aenigmarchaeota archaeon]|nr:class I SAM-dependent methyltransferase [Candidatus Aenigmarchaeota archaeon]MDW8149566.1 class I SAM-dependent methyltransferase [Candidatus Aenigmarchaeota archaeon]